jgi:AraC family transcriptional regulator
MNGKPETLKVHFERINNVLLYIHNHLEETLELNELAGLSNYSPFHFHRIMRAYLGESIGAYIIRLRLERAANLLKLTNLPVNEITYKSGYDSSSSLNKQFKKHFGITPLAYREEHNYRFINNNKTQIIMETKNLKPKIKIIKEKKVIYTRATGAYNESAKNAWDKVCSFAQKNHLFGFGTEFIGISYDDPTITEAENLRYEACICVSKQINAEGEIGVKTIERGKYAIFLHEGPYENFIKTYNYIFGQWLPANNIELRDIPCYEKYLNQPEKTKPQKLKTEIYVPIK